MELILTVMTEDRPGIAERIASVIEQHNASWLESRMACLAGKFAGIIRIVLPKDEVEATKKSLEALNAEGIQITIELGETIISGGSRQTVEIVGNDRPGIIREIASLLNRMNANIIDLQTKLEPAQMSGGLLFKASIEISVANEQALESVIKSLEALSPDLMVDC